jgi:hypothetical protein
MVLADEQSNHFTFFGGNMHFRKLLTISVGVALASLLATLAVGAVNSYKLAYRMKKGQRLKYKTTMNVQNSMEMQGREVTTGSDAVSVLRLEVEEVGKDGNVTFVYALDSLNVMVKTPQGDQSFENPEGMIGKRTRQIITTAGKKLKTVEIDTMQFPGALAQSGGRRPAFSLIELAEKEVKTGDSWTASTADTNAQSGGQIIVGANTTYTVAGEVDTLGYKCLRITYNGKINLKGNGVNMGMNFSVEGEGPNNGMAYFAPKEGLLVAVVGTSDLETTIALTGQMSMTIPQSTANKVAIVLVK